MNPSQSEQGPRQPLWFLLLLALAVGGGAVAYVPFLTVLLPVRITDISVGREVDALAYVTFAGAVFASVANITFGWASDRTGSRRGWIAAGLVLSSLLLVSMRWADSVGTLMALIIAWQIGLNMMLGPLIAWAGDCVPDEQKGLLGGLLACAPALGALSGAFVTIPGLADQDMRLMLVACLVFAMVVPALALGGGRKMAHLMGESGGGNRQPDPAAAPEKSSAAIKRMWFARLLVQIAEAGLFAFLLFWLRSLAVGLDEADSARIFSAVLVVSVPLALAAGRWSDTAQRPFLPLVISAVLTSIGLLTMAAAPSAEIAIGGYVLFGIASMVFLALHSSQTLRVLPRPATRGRDLGLFNLTNTVPSLIAPWLALSIVPVFGYDAMFVVLAGLALAAALLVGTLARKP